MEAELATIRWFCPSFTRRRTSRVLAVIICLFASAHRLPAPISESSTPTPAPAPAAKPKPRAATKEQAEARKKPAAVPFAGTWNGTLISTYRSGGDTGTTQTGCWITISSDGRIISANGDIGLGEIRSPVTRNGMTLTWSGQPGNPSVPLSSTSTCQLQINSATTATFTGTRVIINGFLKGTTYKLVGTLTKE